MYLVGLSHCVVRVMWFRYCILPEAVLLSSQLFHNKHVSKEYHTYKLLSTTNRLFQQDYHYHILHSILHSILLLQRIKSRDALMEIINKQKMILLYTNYFLNTS